MLGGDRLRRTVRWGAVGMVCLVLAPAAGHSWVRRADSAAVWRASSIPVHMRLNLGSTWNDLATDALRAWNNAGSRFQFSWSTSSTIGVECSRSDGFHAAVWSSTACGRGYGGKWAIEWQWWNGGTIVDSDVLFDNTRRDWTRSNFRGLAMHEFGHSLGLGHPDDAGQRVTAIMNSTVRVSGLQSDDIAGVRALYGAGSSGTPDLVVQNLGANDTTLTAGQRFTLSATVRNQGNGTSGSTTLRYYHWRSSTRSWVVVGHDSVPGLRAGSSGRESIALTAPSSTGTHYYAACVVTGQNRSSCGSNLRVTVRAATSGGVPDLVVQSPLRVSDSTLSTGQRFTLFATVRNQGNGTSGSTTLQYYHWRSSTRSWVTVGSDSVGALRAGSSSSETIILTAPSSTGTHYYAACVAAVSGERNTSNCSSNREVTVGRSAGGGCVTNVGTLSGLRLYSGSWTGQCRSVHYSGGEYARYYNFTLSRRSLVTMDLTSSTVDTWLALYHGSGTGGSYITANDDGGTGTDARINRTLGPGTYTIEATTLRGGVSGSFTLWLDLSAGGVADSLPAAAPGDVGIVAPSKPPLKVGG